MRLRPIPAKPAPVPVVVPEGCRWITNSTRPWRFCDRPVDRPGSAWCAVHRRVVYVRGPAWRPGVPS